MKKVIFNAEKVSFTLLASILFLTAFISKTHAISFEDTVKMFQSEGALNSSQAFALSSLFGLDQPTATSTVDQSSSTTASVSSDSKDSSPALSPSVQQSQSFLSGTSSDTPLSTVPDDSAISFARDYVTAIQNLLISQGYLKGPATGLFDATTRSAVSAFQTANGLDAAGVVGPKTLTLLAELSKTVVNFDSTTPVFSSVKNSTVQTSSQSAAATTSVESNITLPQNPNPDTSFSSVVPVNVPSTASMTALKFGDRNDIVKTIQQALISKGFLNASATGLFGKQTQAAIAAFQKANGLAMLGTIGPKTASLLSNLISDNNMSAVSMMSPLSTTTATSSVTGTSTNATSSSILNMSAAISTSSASSTQ